MTSKYFLHRRNRSEPPGLTKGQTEALFSQPLTHSDIVDKQKAINLYKTFRGSFESKHHTKPLVIKEDWKLMVRGGLGKLAKEALRLKQQEKLMTRKRRRIHPRSCSAGSSFLLVNLNERVNIN